MFELGTVFLLLLIYILCTYIKKNVRECIDDRNEFSILRPGSKIFDANSSLMKVDPVFMLRTCLKYGNHDSARAESSQQRGRLNIGVGSTSYDPRADGKRARPKKLVGTQFLENMTSPLEREYFLAQVGICCDFIYACMQDIQKELGLPGLGGLHSRYAEFGRDLANLLKFSKCVCETVTMAADIIFNAGGVTGNGKRHIDRLNAILFKMFSKTGTLSIVIKDMRGNLWLFQIIINWRSAVCHAHMPYHNQVRGIQMNFRNYLQALNQNYSDFASAYTGSLDSLPMTAFNRSTFFLDNDCCYDDVNIASDGKDPIILKILLLKIGVSRVFSMSLIIDSLNRLKNHLRYDQLIEMAILASFMNTPVRYYYIVQKLIERCENQNNAFGLHPFFDYQEIAMTTFGTLQGGKFIRYSAFGQDMEKTLGRWDNLESRKAGEVLWEQIVELFVNDLIYWANTKKNSIATQTKDLGAQSTICYNSTNTQTDSRSFTHAQTQVDSDLIKKENEHKKINEASTCD